MKKVLILFVFATFAFGCSDDDSQLNTENSDLEEVTGMDGSFALRATLENIKDLEHLGRNSQNQNQLCFQFEYPINLEYNDGSFLEVASYSDLLDSLINETASMHITAIEFPFNVIQDNSSFSISNEADFQTLVADCGYDMVSFDDVVAITDECFTVNYPISVFVNDDLETFNSESDAQSFFLNYNDEINALGFDYPFTVNLVEDNTEVVVNDDYELIYLVEETCGIE